MLNPPIFAAPKGYGAVAQSVEQRTENPCVAGSIPAHTTETLTVMLGFFVLEMGADWENKGIRSPPGRTTHTTGAPILSGLFHATCLIPATDLLITYIDLTFLVWFYIQQVFLIYFSFALGYVFSRISQTRIPFDKHEQEKYPIDFPDPIDAIKFRKEQLGYQQKDLVSAIGLKSRVSEILNWNKAKS